MEETTKLYIGETKKFLAAKQDVKTTFEEIRDGICKDVDLIHETAGKGRATIPEVDFAKVQSGNVSDATIAAVKKAGTVIIRGVFPK
jgi:threonine dehydrogenase-like Zn-dependent dehydrogenase